MSPARGSARKPKPTDKSQPGGCKHYREKSVEDEISIPKPAMKTPRSHEDQLAARRKKARQRFACMTPDQHRENGSIASSKPKALPEVNKKNQDPKEQLRPRERPKSRLKTPLNLFQDSKPTKTRTGPTIGKLGRSMLFSSEDDEDGFHMAKTTRGSKSATNKVNIKDVLDFSSSEDELLMIQQPKRKMTKYSTKPDCGPSCDKMGHSKLRGPSPTSDTTRSMFQSRVEMILSSSEDSIDDSFCVRMKASTSRSVAAKHSSSSSSSFKPPSKRQLEVSALTIEKTEPSRKRKSDLMDSYSDDNAGALAASNKKKLRKNSSTHIERLPQKPGSTTQSVASSRPCHLGICLSPDSLEDEPNNAHKKKSKGKSDILATPSWSTACDIPSPPPSLSLKNLDFSPSNKRQSSTKSDKSIFEFSSQDDNLGSKPPGRGSTNGIPTHRSDRWGKEKKTKQMKSEVEYKKKYVGGTEESEVEKCCGVEESTSTESLRIAAVDKTDMQDEYQEMMEDSKLKAQEGTIQTFEKASPNKEQVRPRGRPKSQLKTPVNLDSLFLEQEGGEEDDQEKSNNHKMGPDHYETDQKERMAASPPPLFASSVSLATASAMAAAAVICTTCIMLAAHSRKMVCSGTFVEFWERRETN